LATGLLDHLITMLWYGSRADHIENVNQDPTRVMNVFQGLPSLVGVLHRFDTDQNVEEQLRKIIDALITEKIGLPEQVGRKLVEQEALLASLVEEAAKVWEEGKEYWTEEQTEKYLVSKRKIHQNNRQRENGERLSYVNEYTKSPDTIVEMEAMQTRLKSHGKSNFGLISNLIKAYTNDGKVDKALTTLKLAKEDAAFTSNPSTIDNVVRALVENKRMEEALKLIEESVASDTTQVFGNTLFEFLKGFAIEGKDEKVLEHLNSFSSQQFIRGRTCASDLLDFYAKKGDLESVEKLHDIVVGNNWEDRESTGVLRALVHVHLAKGEVSTALEEFERLARMYKKLPDKISLTKTLIEAEELEGLQKVLDISIEQQGEENSLYDLAFCFLSLDRKTQTKKLFETPGLRFNIDKMEFMIRLFRKEGNITAVEDMVRLSKSIFGCDRDFMFSQLVDTVAADVDRVEEVWMEVQEEGHAPSDSLKLAIASALQAGGREVPFEVPQEYVSQVDREDTTEERIVENKQKKNKPLKKLNDSSSDINQRMVDDAPVAEEIMQLMKGEDFSAARDLMMKKIEEKSLKKKLTTVLIHAEKTNIKEGRKLAAEVCNLLSNKDVDLHKSDVFRHMRMTMKMCKTKEDLDEFYQLLNETQREFMDQSYNRCLRVLSILGGDSTEMLERVKADPSAENTKDWMFSSSILSNVSANFKEGLENLAKEDNEAAKILLAKAALGRNDNKALSHYWGSIKNKDVAMVLNYAPNNDFSILADVLEKKQYIESVNCIVGKSRNTMEAMSKSAMEYHNLTMADFSQENLLKLASISKYAEEELRKRKA